MEEDGREHVRFHRKHEKRRVIGGDFITHSDKDGKIIDVTDDVGALNFKDEKIVSHKDAEKIAEKVWDGKKIQSISAEEVIYAVDDVPVVAYDVLIKGKSKKGRASRIHVIIDAKTKEVITHWDEIFEAGYGYGWIYGQTPFEGYYNTTNQYYYPIDVSRGVSATYSLDDNSKEDGTLYFLMSPTYQPWNLNGSSSPYTCMPYYCPKRFVDVHWATSKVWDYFVTQHDRYGLKDDSVGFKAVANWNAENAFFDPAKGIAVFGNGGNGQAGSWSRNPLTSLDIVGHEFAHGVTFATANFVYAGEPGALHEATSDIF